MKTLVVGASENIERYSNKAIRMLLKYSHEVLGFGNRVGVVDGVEIKTAFDEFENVDTVTMYLGAKNQMEYYDVILNLKPRRIIFNPGAENVEFAKLAETKGVLVENACTLVLLSLGQY